VEVAAMRAAAVEVLQRLAIVALVLLVEQAVLEQQAAYLALVLLMVAVAVARALVETVGVVQAAALHIPITPLQILAAVGAVHGTPQIWVLTVVRVSSSSATLAHSAARAEP
jgi:hypothetical protein